MCDRLGGMGGNQFNHHQLPSVLFELGGWSTAGVGQSYSEGYGLRTTTNFIRQI